MCEIVFMLRCEPAPGVVHRILQALIVERLQKMTGGVHLKSLHGIAVESRDAKDGRHSIGSIWTMTSK